MGKACKHELRKCPGSTWRCIHCPMMFVGYERSESHIKRINVLKSENAMLRSCLKRLSVNLDKRLKKGFPVRRP